MQHNSHHDGEGTLAARPGTLHSLRHSAFRLALHAPNLTFFLFLFTILLGGENATVGARIRLFSARHSHRIIPSLDIIVVHSSSPF
jgi:hypothetical protein